MSIRTENREGVLVITIDRPEKLNATTIEMTKQLKDSILEGVADQRVDVIVLTGAGRAFSTGGDLDEFLALSDLPGLEMFRRYSQTFQADSPYETILTCPKPTIAMVNGPALAGGLALVLSADLAIASETAVFGVPEGKLGLSDHYVATLLRWKIGVSRATYMTLTADMVTAEVAASWGLVVETVPADKLEDRTMRIAGAIQAISPEARAMYKTSAIGELPLLNDARPTVRSALTQNAREGVRAFLERRKPVWHVDPNRPVV